MNKLKYVLTYTFVVLLFLSGCTTLTPVPLKGETPVTLLVQKGDRIKVQTKAGVTLEFKVERVAADAFVGRERRVSFDQIAELEIRRLDKSRTAMVVLLSVVVTAGITAAVVSNNVASIVVL